MTNLGTDLSNVKWWLLMNSLKVMSPNESQKKKKLLATKILLFVQNIR